jgi:predicted metalloprotease with PDZ domain
MSRNPAGARYRISWNEPHDHLFDIGITFKARAAETALTLPAWRPGRYLIQNYAANVREWSATGKRARPLEIRKTAKSSWLVRAEPGETVSVRYRYFAGVLDAGSSFLDETEAYFNGSNLFMMVADRRGEPLALEIHTPAGWDVETQLARRGDAWLARDYDHLIDSPAIVSPSIRRHVFEESGATIHLVFQNADGISTETFVDPLRKIVREQAALFGGLPLRDYRFLFHVGDRWHGVEHEDSSSIILRRDALLGSSAGDDGWEQTLSIASHELFHLWNVKRILPAAFSPYDYSRETPTRLLWAMEGITSYYGDLSLVRAGVWSAERYLEHLAREIEILESAPARAHLSLAQASFDAWLQEPAAMHDRPNAFYSFYTKGELVAALLDLEIRVRTGDRSSLDHVMKALWNEYGAPRRGLPEYGIEKIVRKVTKSDFSDFFARYVEGTELLPYEEAFAAAGLSLRREPRNPGRRSLGVRLRSRDGGLHLDAVMEGGAGRRAGLLAGDELLAVAGHRVGSEIDVQRVLSSLGAEAEAELLFSRSGIIMRRQARPLAEETSRVVIERLPDAGDREKQRRRAWLGRTDD